jgi:hypothetical protein
MILYIGMKKLFFIIFFFSITSNIFASNREGYEFYFNGNRNSSITIQFVEESVPYLTRSDKLFFDILNWIIHNKKTLDNVVNENIVIGIGPERDVIFVRGRMGIGHYEGNDYEKIEKIQKEIFEYKNYNELVQNIYKIIELYFDFSSVPVVNNSFGLYFVWEQDPSILGYHDGVYEQDKYTEIFIGPIPGAMFNKPGLRYGVVFW